MFCGLYITRFPYPGDILWYTIVYLVRFDFFNENQGVLGYIKRNEGNSEEIREFRFDVISPDHLKFRDHVKWNKHVLGP